MIEQELIADASKYSFIEVYKLLCELSLANKLDPLNMIRIRPILGLQHARTQVVSVSKQWQNEQQFLYYLNVNLPGLYGNASPLPKFFTEELVQASHKDQNQTRIFLDLIHQRLYQLLYSANIQQLPHYLDQGRKNVYAFMLAMVGFKDELWLNDFPDKAFILRNVNIFRHQKGTVAGLQNLVQDLFPNATISIIQCVNREVDIATSQKLALNQQANQLSFSTVLGNKMLDLQSKVVLSISPLSGTEYKKWCLSPQYWQAFQGLIQYFIGQPLLVQLHVDIVAEPDFNLCLVPDNAFALGRNAWLANSEQTPHLHAPIKLL
jgi:type VI secretion system protein ImpH